MATQSYGSLLTAGLAGSYEWLISKSDGRVSGWPLMSSPFPLLTLIATYVYFVKIAGPRWMAAKKPFRVEPLILVYNLAMVCLSAFFFFYGGSMTYLPPWGRFSWICESIDYRSTPETMRIVSLGWWLLILKIAEFADTIFFVLRKKFTHISVLHVVHHSLVAWGVWIGLKFGAGGQNAFFPFVNCFVHMVMYSYYTLAVAGPRFRRFLWWKKYLTILQMVQFIVVTIHALLPLVVPGCGVYHPGFAVAIIAHAALFFVMFYHFYLTSYRKEQQKNRNKKQMSGPPGTAAVLRPARSGPVVENCAESGVHKAPLTANNNQTQYRKRLAGSRQKARLDY